MSGVQDNVRRFTGFPNYGNSDQLSRNTTGKLKDNMSEKVVQIAKIGFDVSCKPHCGRGFYLERGFIGQQPSRSAVCRYDKGQLTVKPLVNMYLVV